MLFRSVTNTPQTYTGSAIAATVTCSSTGTVSNVLYGGSSNAPAGAGTYAITANCSANGNYAAVTGASAGNFVINQATPTLSVTNTPQTYNGSAIAAAVTCSSGGTVSNVKYNTSSTVPTNIGTYAITANCAANGNYAAVAAASAGSLVINGAVPEVSVTNSPQTYTGNPIAAVVTCFSGGTVSNILYNGLSTVPTSSGTYAVTADCTANGNYTSVTGGQAGNFVITNLQVPTLTITNTPQTYNGSPIAATVTCSSGGTVSNIEYNGLGTTPTNAGSYVITADCAAAGNYSSLAEIGRAHV